MLPPWRADGQELYFRSQGRIVAAAVELGAGGQLEVGPQEPIGDLPWRRVAANHGVDVTPDGRRFLLLLNPEGGSSALRLVDGWLPELEAPR